MREKRLEIVFICLSIVFAAAGYGFYQFGVENYRLTARDPDTLRIVTWNVGGAGGYGGRNLRDEHLPHIGDVLNQLDADVILLQEIASDHQLRRLKRLLKGRPEIVRSSGRSRSLAIVARRGQLQVRNHAAPGLRALAASYYPSGKPPVLLLNIHAHPYSAEARNISIGRATDVLMRYDPAHLKILAGDLNLDIDIGKRRDLFSNNQHLDVETYNYLLQHLSDLTRNTGSTAEPDRRLDYIFGDTGRMAVVRSGPWKGRRIEDMDHDPVVADLQILPIE
jgi:endonuclease/exonuclease/phosphatase family metal-dependent hydrolase